MRGGLGLARPAEAGRLDQAQARLVGEDRLDVALVELADHHDHPPARMRARRRGDALGLQVGAVQIQPARQVVPGLGRGRRRPVRHFFQLGRIVGVEQVALQRRRGEAQETEHAVQRPQFRRRIQRQAEAEALVFHRRFPIDRAQLDSAPARERHRHVLRFVGELVEIAAGEGLGRALDADRIGLGAVEEGVEQGRAVAFGHQLRGVVDAEHDHRGRRGRRGVRCGERRGRAERGHCQQ
nr:hypothetical protein [Lysobacter enzymogenes]